jgi:2-oxoisovalerate dehydrogenase E1 component alpha subunit
MFRHFTVARLGPQTRHIHLGHLPNSRSPIVPTLSFFNSVTGSNEKIPTFRVLDGVGKPVDGAQLPEVRHGDYFCRSNSDNSIQIDEAFARKLYENMQLLPTLDTVLYNVQRQGKISFHVGFSSLVIYLCSRSDK